MKKLRMLSELASSTKYLELNETGSKRSRRTKS